VMAASACFMAHSFHRGPVYRDSKRLLGLETGDRAVE
jgi:hypothetical protein